MPESNRLRMGLSLCGALLLGTEALAQDIRIPQSRDRATEFVGFVAPRNLHLRPLVFAGLPPVEFKQLSFDEKSGARTLLVTLPAGWKMPSGYHSADLEMFVVEGGISVGDKPLGRYAYAYYPAGTAHSFGSKEGATVLFFFSGAPDYTASATSRAGAKPGAIDGLAYHDVPTTTPAVLPKYRDEPVMKNSPVHVKLFRADPATGEATWIQTSPGGYPVMSGEGALPLWATSKGWEEGFMLAGDLTIAECLPQGQVAGTYAPNGYFFRPAGVAHGGLSQYSDSYAVWLYRSGPGVWKTYTNSCAEPAQAK